MSSRQTGHNAWKRALWLLRIKCYQKSCLRLLHYCFPDLERAAFSQSYSKFRYIEEMRLKKKKEKNEWSQNDLTHLQRFLAYLFFSVFFYYFPPPWQRCSDGFKKKKKKTVEHVFVMCGRTLYFIHAYANFNNSLLTPIPQTECSVSRA